MQRSAGNQAVDGDAALETGIDADQRLRPEAVGGVEVLDLRLDVGSADESPCIKFHTASDGSDPRNSLRSLRIVSTPTLFGFQSDCGMTSSVLCSSRLPRNTILTSRSLNRFGAKMIPERVISRCSQ